MKCSFKNKQILITAGPTREKIDPVRFISNYSTGYFGYALAGEALKRGYKVTLISGPVSLKPPVGARFITVESALDMEKAVMKEIDNADIFIMAAAVSDWRVSEIRRSKIKKEKFKGSIELVKNPDILKKAGTLKKGKIIVAFALETENLERNALDKMRDKDADIIIANSVGKGREVFGDNLSDVLILDNRGGRARHKNFSKKTLSKIILDKISDFNI